MLRRQGAIDGISYRKPPPELPQRLDAIMVRHALFKRLGAHDPMLRGLFLALACGSGSTSRVRRHDASS